MKKINMNVVMLFTGGILLGFILSYCTIKLVDNYNYVDVNKNDKEEQGYVIYPSNNNNESQEKENINNQDVTNKNEEVNNNSSYVDGNIYENNTENSSDNSLSKENNITPVSYFENINNSNDQNALKEGFVKIVDFIFYGTEINGYTFKSLTNEAKLKIMSLALSLDKKVEEIFPGYKETISNGAKTVYNNVKGFVVELYLDTVTMVCEKSPNSCELAKEGFANLKMSFGITWDLIKSFTNIGVEKLKEWYEIFRG